MTLAFTIIAALTIAAAVAAMTLRNLVHCALALTVAFAGLAAAYLQLDAQFVGFAQIFVYIGAVAILLVFAILLTRGGESAERNVFSKSWVWGLGVVLAVFSTLAWAIQNSFASQHEPTETVQASVKQIGDALMTKFVLPLEVIGLLLTAALIGAVIIAMRDESPGTRMEDGGSKKDKPSAPSSTLHPPSSGGAA
ncbi:MAG: NADH-quinone oxidoreductase subunit J [Verrucomicrobia bacterium]|nr:NADH-quinone oxidoreductase subunit J [Verrucomicrobiota bacterium]